MKIYVVVRQSFGYDDERYYREDGSQPVIAYSTKEAADKVASAKNQDWIFDVLLADVPESLAMYGRYLESLFTSTYAVANLLGIPELDEFDDIDINDLRSLKGEQMEEFIKLVHIRPFSVVEVELNY